MGGGDGQRLARGHLNHGGPWHHGKHWPYESLQPMHFYLRQDGRLSLDTPMPDNSSTTLCIRSEKYCFQQWLLHRSLRQGAQGGFFGMGPRDRIDLETLPSHGFPGKSIAERPGLLYFQTPVLSQDVRIAGNIQDRLRASSDAADTYFYVKLLDIHPPSADYPSGYPLPVSEVILRARYRRGFGRLTMMQSGEIYRLEFPLEPAATLFQVGYRIGAYICSSNFPHFDINPKIGDPNDRRPRIARNTIYHDAYRLAC